MRQAPGQLALLDAIPCPGCGSEHTLWVAGSLWECPACGHEWRDTDREV